MQNIFAYSFSSNLSLICLLILQIVSAVDEYRQTHMKKDKTKKAIKMLKKLDEKSSGRQFFNEVLIHLYLILDKFNVIIVPLSF